MRPRLRPRGSIRGSIRGRIVVAGSRIVVVSWSQSWTKSWSNRGLNAVVAIVVPFVVPFVVARGRIRGHSKLPAYDTVEEQNDAPPQTHLRKEARDSPSRQGRGGACRFPDCNVRSQAKSRGRWCNNFVLSWNRCKAFTPFSSIRTRTLRAESLLADATICLFAGAPCRLNSVTRGEGGGWGPEDEREVTKLRPRSKWCVIFSFNSTSAPPKASSFASAPPRAQVVLGKLF